jgi:transposase
MTVITVRATSDTSLCPGCGAGSKRVHSRYRRRLADLPLAGRMVQLVIAARRFRCDAVLCGRRVFTERFVEGILAPWARRTARLDYVVHQLSLSRGAQSCWPVSPLSTITTFITRTTARHLSTNVLAGTHRPSAPRSSTIQAEPREVRVQVWRLRGCNVR